MPIEKFLYPALAIIVTIILLPFMPFQKQNNNMTFGVTYSPQYAASLELDWKKNYKDVLENLQVKHLRLPTYWSDGEKIEGKYDFSNVDFMMEEAKKNNAKVILVTGIKQPRWPECHVPTWAKKLTIEKRREAALAYMKATVERYKDHPALSVWQVENEPLFGFGENCDPADLNFLKKEIALVKELDPNHKIMVTDTGEWSFWIKAMGVSDILGISMYRKANIPGVGNTYFPFPVAYYTLRSNLMRPLFARNNEKTIIAEQQTEPWLETGLKESPLDMQIKRFNIDDFKNTIDFARKTNFSESYLWGIEWMYWMAERGHPEYLEYAKTLF